MTTPLSAYSPRYRPWEHPARREASLQAGARAQSRRERHYGRSGLRSAHRGRLCARRRAQGLLRVRAFSRCARRAMRGAMRWAARRRPPARDRSVWQHPRKRDSAALSRLCGLDAVSRCLPRAKARVPRRFGADGRGRSGLRLGGRPGDPRTFVRVGGNGAFPLSNLGPRDAPDACGGVFRNARASRSRRRVSALASGNCRLPARIPRHGCPRRAHRRRCGIADALSADNPAAGARARFRDRISGVSAARVHVRCPGRALRERSACGGRHRRRCIE